MAYSISFLSKWHHSPSFKIVLILFHSYRLYGCIVNNWSVDTAWDFLQWDHWNWGLDHLQWFKSLNWFMRFGLLHVGHRFQHLLTRLNIWLNKLKFLARFLKDFTQLTLCSFTSLTEVESGSFTLVELDDSQPILFLI